MGKPIDQSKSILHTKWKKVLEAKVVRRANPTKLVKREVCRPPPKPPDWQYSLNYKQETKKGREKPYRNQKEGQEIQNADEEGIDAQKIRQGTKFQAPSKATLYTRCQGRSDRDN